MTPELAKACDDYADALAAQEPPITDETAEEAARLLAVYCPQPEPIRQAS